MNFLLELLLHITPVYFSVSEFKISKESSRFPRGGFCEPVDLVERCYFDVGQC